MKILHLLGPMLLPRDPGATATSGVVRAALELGRAQVRLGHEVWVAAVGRDAWEADFDGLRLAQLRYVPRARLRLGARTYDFRAHLPSMALTRRVRFDVVQGHLYTYLRFLPAAVRVAHFHSDPFYRAAGGDAPSAADLMAVARSSEAQVAVSAYIAGQLHKGLGSHGNVHVVHNGVDGQRFDRTRWEDERRRLRSAWQVADGEVVFLYAGALVPEKGVLHLARAFARLGDRLEGVHLAIAGSGSLWDESLRASDPARSYEGEVRRAVEATRRRGKVHFLGKVEAPAMAGVYAATDAAAIPSTWPEPFPLVALEALASGLPVVASATGGLPEVVGPTNGALVAPGDEAGIEAALQTLAREPELRRRLGEAAREGVRHLTWEEAARKLERVYASSLSRGPGEAPSGAPARRR